MSIYDCFYNSIAGMHRAEGYLEQAANYLAAPSTWGQDEASVSQPSTSFAVVLANAMNQQGGRDGETGGDGGPVPYVPSPNKALDGLGVGEGQGPGSIMDAIVLAMIAQRMYEANARMFAIENRIVGIMIHLGEENYRPGS